MSALKSRDDVLVGIGALARSAGIPPGTLRTWERRYGFPRAVRLPSGHRRYPASLGAHLVLVRRALERGHRPSTVLGLDAKRLEALLSGLPPATAIPLNAPPWAGMGSRPAGVSHWMRWLADGDDRSLAASIQAEWDRLGAFSFFELRLGPFLREIGRRWRAGQLSIPEEHLATEVLQDFLSSRRRELGAGDSPPTVLCATLPGERHTLGLHAAAVAVASGGRRVAFLGAEVPVEDLVAAAEVHRAAGVVLSISGAARADDVFTMMASLVARLGPRLQLAVGGEGAPAAITGVRRFEDFPALARWAEALGSMIPARTGDAPA